jgi:Tol biopolymer transport system component
VWLRNHPLDRAIGILWLGDVFVARRSARNPHFGGDAKGHEMRRGWVPRAALCGRLPRQPDGFSSVAGPSGAVFLSPPSELRCDDAKPRRRLIEVGVDFPRRRGAAVRADLIYRGHVLRGPVFQPGQAESLSRGAVGPFRCASTVTVVYRRLGHDASVVHAADVRISTGASAQASAARRDVPSPACASKPVLLYAHGHAGPISHRYDARPAVSRDGRAIAFDTPLALVPADRNRSRDVYLRTGRALHLLSRNNAGRAGSATSRAPAISADGRRVAFESDTADLAPGDANGARDVLVADGGGPPRLVSVTRGGTAGNGRSRSPSLSADGLLLAFESRATDLVSGAPEEGIYVARLGTDVPAISLAVADAYRPALSADGSTLVFESSRPLSPADRNRTVDVYALELTSGVVALVSARRDGRAGSDRSLAGVPSGDGRYVAFMSAAGDLVGGDSDRLRDVFRRDMRTRRTVLVSRDRCGGFANGYSRYPSISESGRFVAFDSHAGDVIGRATRGEGEVYLRDVARGRTRIASTRRDGRPSSRTAFSPALSADGRVVAFPSFGSDLVPGDANHRVDQFAWHSRGGAVHRVS